LHEPTGWRGGEVGLGVIGTRGKNFGAIYSKTHAEEPPLQQQSINLGLDWVVTGTRGPGQQQ